MKKKKITLDEFWSRRTQGERLAIHCDTEEKARTLLTAFDKMGKIWSSGERYSKTTEWDDYTSYTVYTNNSTYTDLMWTWACDIPVYEFEEVDLQDYLNKKYPITLDEFWRGRIGNQRKIFGIHCDTEEKARTLLTAFDKMGKKWRNGLGYTETLNWEEYGLGMVYFNDGTCSWLSCSGYHLPIYEFEEVDLTKYLDNDNQNEQEKGE